MEVGLKKHELSVRNFRIDRCDYTLAPGSWESPLEGLQAAPSLGAPKAASNRPWNAVTNLRLDWYANATLVNAFGHPPYRQGRAA